MLRLNSYVIVPLKFLCKGKNSYADVYFMLVACTNVDVFSFNLVEMKAVPPLEMCLF